MRIIHIITGLGVGGAERMLHQLLRHLKTQNNDHHIVINLSNENKLESLIRQTGSEVISFSSAGIFSRIRMIFKARSIVRAKNTELIMTWMHHADFFGVILKALCPTVPLVWNIRCSKLDSSVLPMKNLILVRGLSLLSKVPDMIVANSYAGMREHIALGYRRDGWRIIPNGFDIEQFYPDVEAGKLLRQSLALEPDAFLIGLIARYHPMKGFDLLIKAAKSFTTKNKEAHFVLVGRDVNWLNIELSKKIISAGLENRFSLLDEREDISDVMNMLDLLVSTSTSEGFPNVVGEAMACGTPCVVTDVGDCRFIVGEAGIVIPPEDEEAFVSALEQMLSMPRTEYRSLQEQARARIERKFSISKVSSLYQEMFNETEKKKS